MRSGVPDEWPLSPGAQRVIGAARDAAAEQSGGVVTGFRILHALWSDESRAAEVLRIAGFDATASSLAADESELEDVLHAVLRGARRHAARRGEGEIGTEHLLAALLDIDVDLRDLLPGIDAAGLMRPQGVGGSEHEPLEFDEELSPAPREDPPTKSVQPPAPFTTHHSPLTTDALRILDAAANRGREGLRVVEDFVRFRLNDAHLSGLLKSLRHDLSDALSRLGSASWHRLRDTPGDVGTAVETLREFVRGSLEDVVLANCKRVEESLRSLEEYGKLVDAGPSAAIERLRYQFYTIEQTVLTAISSRTRLDECRLYLLVSEVDCPHGLERTVRDALAGGVDVIQLREKGTDGARFLSLARQVRLWTREAGALLVVNDRPDVAVLSDADGVHVGQEDLSCRDARRIVGAERLVGVSTHSIEQARQAVLDGADYIGVGPVFASQTKQFNEFAGLDYVREAAAEISLPWFAIGGIDTTNVADVVGVGAARVAVSRAVCMANDVHLAAKALSGGLVGAS
jgi:thiamine-phosphate pyrophosphorylase